jgi:hypothetical protein
VAAKFPALNVELTYWDDTNKCWYPKTIIQTGTAGPSYLSTATNTASVSGSLLSTPTGTQTWIEEMTRVNWADSNASIDNGTGGAGNRGIRLRLSSGFPQMIWSPDGTAWITVSSSAAVPFANGAHGWVKRVFVPNNGSGSYTVDFYTSTDGVNYTHLGTQQTGTATTVFASTSDWLWNLTSAMGTLYGLTGYSGANIIFPQWLSAFMTNNITSPILGGGQTLHISVQAMPGSDPTWWSTASRVNGGMMSVADNIVWVILGHNLSTHEFASYTGILDTFMGILRAVAPQAQYVFFAENPQNNPTPDNSVSHASRNRTMPGYCSKNGIGFASLEEVFATDPRGLNAVVTPNDVRPTAAGYSLQASTVFHWIFG